MADLSEWWRGQKCIKLLDPNLLACPEHMDLLGQLADSGAWVDFTQGLDARLLTMENIAALNTIKLKEIHFAWDYMAESDAVMRGLRRYATYGRKNRHGKPANEEMKARVLSECSADERRPLTDLVSVEDAGVVKLDINVTSDHIDSDKQRRVLERLNFYKNLRSHNDGVTYFVEAAPAIAKAASSVTGFKETTHVSLAVPVPIIRPTASARVGTAAGLWESAEAHMELNAPVLRRASLARVGVSAGIREEYTTGEIKIDTQEQTASVQARARGAVAARQEATRTTINFNRR